MEITGKVIARTEKREGTSQKGNHWSMITYVVEEVNVQHPKKVALEIFGDEKVEAVMNTKLGNKIVTASFDIDASEYNKSWYNRIRCWKLVLDGKDILDVKPKQQVAPQQASTAPAGSGDMGQNADDDLPF